MIHPVVMAGGKGERFWPYSNSRHPKQLLPLVTSESMLEDTLRNIRALGKTGPVRLVVSKNLEKPVKAKTRGMKNVITLAEPQGRNTAAAVALAARLIMRERGLRGFWVGLTIGYVKVMPLAATSFFVYERMKTALGI